MSNNNVLIKLQSLRDFLTSAEQTLADFILNNKEDIINMSTKQLASSSGVSEATIIRLARKLDTDGYVDFKLKLAANLVTPDNLDSFRAISLDDSPIDIYNKVVSSTSKSLEYTSSILDNNEIQRAVDIIKKTGESNKNIFLLALGASSIVARDFQNKLMKLNINCIYFEDMHLSAESILNITSDDILIVFSTLGKSAHTHHCIDIAKSKDANIILITQYGNEAITNKGDILLLTSNIEDNLRIASHTSLITQLIIVDTLFISLATNNYESTAKAIKQTKDFFKSSGYYLD